MQFLATDINEGTDRLQDLLFHFSPMSDTTPSTPWTFVRPPEQIDKKFLNFFKKDLKTNLPLDPEKKNFLSQVLMHEMDEGIRLLTRAQRTEEISILQKNPSKLPVPSLMGWLRSLLHQQAVTVLGPERIRWGSKIRNNQIGQISVEMKHGEGIGFTSVGIGYKKQNEDAILFLPDQSILALMDGMGGHVGGNIASGILVDFLEYAIKTGYTLQKAIAFANEAILQRTRNDPTLGGHHPMGSTLVTCEISADQLRCFHAGDSKLMVIRNGKIVHESKDHTNGQELLREKLIDVETAYSLNHVLSRTLGCDSILPQRDLEETKVDLQPGDRVLMASDGITDNFYLRDFSLHELADIAGSRDMNESVEMIQDLYIYRMQRGHLPDGRPPKSDNISLILYEHLPS